jgi:fibronectin-binding autotransporter adhesin
VGLNNNNQLTAGPVIFGTAGAANTTSLTFSQYGRTFANAISTQGTGGTNTIQSQGGEQPFYFTGGITLANNLTLSTFGGSDNITVQTGAIGGTGNLETNVTTISAGGGAGAAGTVGSSGGGIALNSTVNNIGTITNDGNGTSTVGINGNIGSNVTNVIQNSATSGLILSGANTYTGPTTVSAGTLTAGVASVAGTSGAFGNGSAVSLANVSGSTLALANFNTQIGSLAGGGTTGGTVTLGAAMLTTGQDATSTNFAGVISGTGGLTKIGTGTQTLSGMNTYTGATAVGGGTLALNITNTLATSSSITVNSNGTLALTASSALATPGATTSTTQGSPSSVSGQVPIMLSGGTLLRNGAGVSLGSQSGSMGTVGIGSLTLTAASTIDFGTTGVGTLNFNGLAGVSGTNALTIINYTTTEPAGSAGVDGTDDRIIFNQNVSSFLPDITLDGMTPSELALGNGEYELIAPVPEPATWAAGVLALVAVGYQFRRRAGLGIYA